ncbi:uncharacterized protein [Periplaneta americana]|uniref:uncharacterized protein isoform X1 n=1 Tax=Periplaneta americana TaxID=6978 RepID=UPI0037E97CFC
MLQDKGMKYTCLTCLIFIAGFPLSSPVIRKPDNSTLGDQRLLSRKKRYLNFPDGSILQLGYCLQVAGLIGSDLIFGYTIGTNWDLPSSVNVQLHRDDKQKADGIHRRHRRDLYAKLEPILTTMGVNGRACILRALCEAGRRKPEKGTFLQEILYSIFTFKCYNINTPMTSGIRYSMDFFIGSVAIGLETCCDYRPDLVMSAVTKSFAKWA